MKDNYSKLNKEEKKKIKEKYKKEYAKSDIHTRLTRLTIYSIVGYVFSIFLVVYSIITKEDLVSNLIIAIPLFILSCIFVVGIIIIKRRLLNKLASK